MPVKKYRSLSEAPPLRYIPSETKEHWLALRSVFWMANQFAPPQARFPGVHKYRSLAEAQADRRPATNLHE